jgi:hypothetical protein
MSRRPIERPTDDGGPASSAPLRNRFAADPSAVLAPGLAGLLDVRLMTIGRCTLMGSGDKRPPVLRPGCGHCATLPSRMGQALRWPDGRITHLDGTGDLR